MLASYLVQFCYLAVLAKCGRQFRYSAVVARNLSMSIIHNVIETQSISDKQQEALPWEFVPMPKKSKELSRDRGRR